MDVLSLDASSAAASAAQATPPPSQLAPPADPGPVNGAPAVPTPTGSAPVGIAPTGSAPTGSAPTDDVFHDRTLHSALSQLVGNGAQVSVQFRVVHDPNEIVTVFTNAQTGQVITQFPPESMVLIAQFFNKLAGAVLDQSA
ncbi:MAG: flagellar protein FlaG [Vulcanimicrobiaceae bacterium]|jgi:uncharacterized iron-regulated membrane protein